MFKKGLKSPLFWYLLVIICVSALILPTTLLAGKAKTVKQNNCHEACNLKFM